MSRGALGYSEIKRVVLFLVLGTGIGFVLDEPILVYAIAASSVLIRWLWYLRRASFWLEKPDSEPPEAKGIWGHLFDSIYRLQRQSRATQNELSSALDYLQDSLASMRDAAIIVDSRDNIAWSNYGASELLGIRSPEDIGQPILSLIRAPQFHEYFDSLDHSTPLRIPPSLDNDRCFSVEISSFGAGDRLIFVRDITEWYRLEQMRRDFVGNVSHELRTPLTVIKGYIETLQSIQADNDTLTRPLKQMGEQALRMENLLRDLLWLSKIESVETKRKSTLVDMPDLLDEIVSELRAAYSERELILELNSAVKVYGDYQELHSACSNLIVNALKYSEAPAPVTITWEERGDEAWMSVQDEGFGIEAEHIPRLTERFYRVDKSRSQRIGGTGLGLAIVKHVATSHNAELDIQSEYGYGSCFSLVFPASEQAK